MNLEEKIGLLSGGFLFPWRTKSLKKFGIESMYIGNGTHGIKREIEENDEIIGGSEEYYATCFPCGCLFSCSFDRDLIYHLGVALGKESLDLGIDILLGPAINIKRNPLCGKNFDCISEDPLLSGELGFLFISVLFIIFLF